MIAMSCAGAAPGVTASTAPTGNEPRRMVLGTLNLVCDNVTECGSTFLARDTWSETSTAARVHGWRIWPDAAAEAGFWVLCPRCVGQRTRRDPVPERLDGEQPLF